jgi:RNA polymerase primary sigma factor
MMSAAVLEAPKPPRRRLHSLRPTRHLPLDHAATCDSAGQARARRLLALPLAYHVCREFAVLSDDLAPPALAHLDEASLLAAEEEAALFVRMNYCLFQADALRRLLCPSAPTPSLLRRIEGLLAAAEQIRNCLLRVFLKLAVSQIGPFLSRRHPFDELYSEAAAALLRSVQGFHPDRGCRFSTYATTAVRRALERHVTGSHKHARRFMPAEHLDTLPARKRSTAADDARRAESHCAMQRMLRRLSQREQAILRDRFGLAPGGEASSLQQIALRLGVSRERVRQLETRALGKLRAMPDARQLQAAVEAH